MDKKSEKADSRKIAMPDMFMKYPLEEGNQAIISGEDREAIDYRQIIGYRQVNGESAVLGKNGEWFTIT